MHTHIRPRFPSAATRRPRWACAALLACAAARSGTTAPRVTVQALPRFEDVRREQTPGGLELQLRLVDDVGKPLVARAVTLGRDGQAPLRARPCSGGTRGVGGALSTDSAGELCMAIAGARDTAELVLQFAGDALYLPAEARVPLQASSAELHLAFDAPSLELNLDQPEQRLGLEWSGPGASDATLPSITLQLEEAQLAPEGGSRVLEAQDWQRDGNMVRGRVASEDLGAPGPARLLARAHRAEDTSPIVAEALVLRSATVQLERQQLSIGRDALELDVAARTRAGVPAVGWVELRGDGQTLGSSPLVAGVGNLQLTLLPSTPQQLEVLYHADDPWWLPGEALALDLALSNADSQEPARWPWLVLLAPVGYVCVRALERPAPRKQRRGRRAPPRPVVPTGLRPVSLASPASGWAGTVTDAHDGQPIAGAQITALLPSLRNNNLGVSAISDAGGHFVLPPLQETIPEGAQLRVSSRFHSELLRPLPPQGRVSVTLTSRKRALLERLVRWARSAGPPWYRSSEPTPGEVADVALRRGDRVTAHWAESVQAAAFAGADVEEHHEAALREQEPGRQQSAAHPDRHTAD
ncbi:MAG: hypothetical protein RL685_6895 [Pseudomonadota bacterium]